MMRRPTPISIRFLALAILSVAIGSAEARAAEPPGFDVIDYAADLTPDLASHTVAGEVAIRLVSRAHRLSRVELAAVGLAIESVTESGKPLPFETQGGKLLVTLRPAAARGKERTLAVRYSGKPTRGIRFGTDQIHTAFHTSHWLVSQDDPSDKASLTLRLTLPEGLDTVANGKLLDRSVLADGRVRHVWREERPHSTYLFGFAAGRFQRASRQHGAVELRFASLAFPPAELERIFANTAAALEFFERKAGLPFPGESYTQVLMPEAPAQEASGFSLLSEAYGKSVLADPREDYLIAHELAHQWWGNLVTCASWSDFWLNEGVATFMTAAFKEVYWGREEYEREIVIARLRYERAIAQGTYRPLVFTRWSSPEEMGGPLTYSRGALVLHLLRHHLGERAFWEGLRDLTRGSAGKTVDTVAFRAAMERASGKDLGGFFSQWAYSEEPEALVARHWLEPGAVVIEIEQRQSRPWSIPITVAIRTENQEVSRRVLLEKQRETFRFAIGEAPVSVRVDADGALPRFVEHERPLAMLLHQLRFEPDTSGRAEALLAFEKACGEPAKLAECREARPILKEAAASDSSRLVRQLAASSLEKIGGE